MTSIDGFILAGGASSRMGVDKSQLLLGREKMFERAAVALSSVTSNVAVVSSRHQDNAFPFPVVRDIQEARGALGGIHAALKKARAPWVAIVSCDLPFVTGRLFERLASFALEGRDAIAPIQQDGRPQPLCALYRRDACLKVVEELLNKDELRPRVLLARVRTFWVKPEDLCDLPGQKLFFLNVNTPVDYEYALTEFKNDSYIRDFENRRELI